MKIVNIAVEGGIARVTRNPNKVNINIVDCDGECGDLSENEIQTGINDILALDPNATIVKVWRGIADVEHSPSDVEVRIKDYDKYL